MVENKIQKYLYHASHEENKVKIIWWYSLTSGEIRWSTNYLDIHSSSCFRDIYEKPGWIRGRIFEDEGKNYLLIYLYGYKRVTENVLMDLLSKLNSFLDKDISYVFDSNGTDLSNLLENIDENIKLKFKVEKFMKEFN
jgi:hypothetical protein